MEDTWCFVVGKDSDLTTVYRGSCMIGPALFVCCGSCLFRSAVFLIRIRYARIWHQVCAGTDCLLEEPADCVNCLEVVWTWWKIGQLTKVCLEMIGIRM